LGKNPNIDIQVGLDVHSDIPMNSENYQVTPLTFEKFNSYYLNTLSSLINFFPNNSEYYFKYNSQEFNLQCYSDNRYLKINIDYRIGYFRCSIHS